MQLLKYSVPFLTLAISFFSYADSNNPYSDETYKLYCDRIASDMRVNLRALESLNKNAPVQAIDAIIWLEQALKMDQLALKNLSEKSSCTTENVKNILREVSAYNFHS